MLDITEEWDTIATKIHEICADLEVFISYSAYDQKTAEVLQNVLVEKDYSVWTLEDNFYHSEKNEKNFDKINYRS